MSGSVPVPWGDFTHDPRRTETGALRASDRDRDVVLKVLGEGYADGRLTREEYDERADATTQARTLGELPAIIADLVPQQPIHGALVSPADLQSQAVAEYGRELRSAVTGLVVVSVITVSIWLVLGSPWPMIVALFAAANLLRMLLQRKDVIADHRRKLEKRQRKALKAPPPEDEPG